MYAGQNPAHPVQAVYVAEAETGAVGWAGRLRAGAGRPGPRVRPARRGRAAAVPAQLRGRFAGAVGLLAGQGRRRPADQLRRPPRQPRAEADPNKRKLVFAGLAAAALLLGGRRSWGWLQLAAADDAAGRRCRADKAELERTAEADWSRTASGWPPPTAGPPARSCVLDELFDMTDRFPKDDTMRVNSFDRKAMPVTKDGKQRPRRRSP